jgi:hypothetical protein
MFSDKFLADATEADNFGMKKVHILIEKLKGGIFMYFLSTRKTEIEKYFT